MIIITIIAIIVAIIFVSFGIYMYFLYKEEKQRADNKIENSIILQNAVLEAYQSAEEKDNKFEIWAYKKLYETLKGKR